MRKQNKYYSKETFKILKNEEWMKSRKVKETGEIVIYIACIILGLVMAVAALPKPNYFGITMGCAFMSAAISNLEPFVKKPWLCMTGVIIGENFNENDEFESFVVHLENNEEITLSCDDNKKYRVGNKVYTFARVGSYGTIIGFC